MTFEQRQRQLAYATREAAGQSLWTKTLDDRVRVRVRALVASFGETIGTIDSYSARDDIGRDVRTLLALRSGFSMQGQHPYSSMLSHIGTCTTDVLLSILDLVAEVLPLGLQETFEEALNDVFREERIAYEMIGLQIIPIQDQHMHAEIVAPTLRLLSGRVGWDEVERAFRDALEQIAIDPANAITDAGTALQQALTAAGMNGNKLGSLVKDAITKGALAPHDATLNSGIGKIMDWVSADRSTNGDAHNAKPASAADAWLIIHVVGALVLRLADGAKRDQSK